MMSPGQMIHDISLTIVIDHNPSLTIVKRSPKQMIMILHELLQMVMILHGQAMIICEFIIFMIDGLL